MTKAEQIKKFTEIFQKAKQSLPNFYRIFFKDEDNFLKAPDFHNQISDILLNGNQHFALECFRESGKSSLVLTAFPLYCLLYPHKKRSFIAIIKANQTLAEKVIKSIIGLYKSNPLFSHNLVKIKEESAKSFVLIVKNSKGEEVEIVLQAYGKGASIRGLNYATSDGVKRPDLILMDDPQDLEDSISDTVQEKDWNWFLSDVLFLGKNTRIFLIGNNLGERCIIERIFTNKERWNFDTIKIPALQDDKPTWEEAFDYDFLMKEKEALTAEGKLEVFYRERLCVALPPEQQEFKKEYFKYWHEEDLKEKNLKYYVAVDLAISQKETADNTSIMVIGKEDDTPDWYIVENIYGKLDPLKVIDSLFYVNNKYRPIRVGIESVGYQKSLMYFLNEEMKKRQELFNIVEIKTTQKKEIKIRGLIPMYRTGTIHHQQTNTQLEEELLSFPLGLHDDCVDSLAMLLEVTQNTHSSSIMDRKRKRNNNGFLKGML